MVQPAFGCTQYQKAGRNTQQAFINGITQVEGGWMGHDCVTQVHTAWYIGEWQRGEGVKQSSNLCDVISTISIIIKLGQKDLREIKLGSFHLQK